MWTEMLMEDAFCRNRRMRVFLAFLRQVGDGLGMVRRVVLVASDVFVRRLTPALAALVPQRLDFRVVDIFRPPGELVRRVRALEPDGIITESLPRLTEAILALGVPTVIADSDRVYPGAVSIDVDDAAVGAEAAQFFLASGYENLACVHNELPYGEQRFAGFRRALRAAGRPVHDFRQVERRPRYYMETWNAPTDRLRDWLRALPRPVGIFAVHDPLARLIAQAAEAAGLAVPEDVAVVGANNDDFVCQLGHPPLSSVEIPWQRIGALAGDWVQRLMAGRRPARRAVLVRPGPVAVRLSTARHAVTDPELRRVVGYLREHAREPVTIGRACAALRVSRRGVERKFAALLRISPARLLTRTRVEMAKSLLLGTDRPMGAIAEACGFGDGERFAVAFRRETGLTPRAFRRGAVTAGARITRAAKGAGA